MTNEKNTRLSRFAARLGIAGIALAATLGIAACGGDDGGGGGGGEVALVAYSTATAGSRLLPARSVPSPSREARPS